MDYRVHSHQKGPRHFGTWDGTVRHLGQDSSVLRSELSLGHFGTSADLSGQFGPTKLLPKCPGSEVSWVRSVRNSSMDTSMSTSIYSLLYIKYYNQLDSRTDLSPIPVRSAIKSYKTSWCIQNLSKHALNRQTVSTSTTELGRLFQILTIAVFSLRMRRNVHLRTSS